MKNRYPIFTQRFEEFTFNDELGFDIEVEVEFHPGEPEVRYLSNGDPGHPATPPSFEIIGVEVKSAIVSCIIEEYCLIEMEGKPDVKKAFEIMLLDFFQDNLDVLEIELPEDLRCF